MNSGSKKHMGSEECRDRLSQLPDEILVHILSFLPTVDAVRTVLLKRFGDLWTLVPNLQFIETGSTKREDGELLQLSCSPFLIFVQNVLFLHKSPTIDKVSLEVLGTKYVEDVGKLCIEVWIRCVLSKKAKVLHIGFHTTFDVPACIYTSQCLVELTLEGCLIELPSRIHMRSLRTLKIEWSSMEDSINDFVSGCPLLKELIIHYVEGMGVRDLSFSSPSIEKLEIMDVYPIPWKINCPNIKILVIDVLLRSVEVINVPSVRELTFGRDSKLSEEYAHQIKRILEGCRSCCRIVKHMELYNKLLYWGCRFHLISLNRLMQLAVCLVGNVGFPKNKWKRVILRSSVMNTHIVGICILVRNSPCLEELIIHVHKGKRDKSLVPQEASSTCEAPNLKLISMHVDAWPYKSQLLLVKFLLKSAVNLDKLVVHFNRRGGLTSTEEQTFVLQLSEFSRASIKARIVLERNY